jgi:hypothetical protein
MRRFPFVTVDVFTSRALEGNGLAVFTDARGLSDSEMQVLAREMHLPSVSVNVERSLFQSSADPEIGCNQSDCGCRCPYPDDVSILSRSGDRLQVRLKISAAYICYLENGKRSPSASVIQRYWKFIPS